MDITIHNKFYNEILTLSHDEYPYLLHEDGVDWGVCEAEFSTVSDIKGYGEKETNVRFATRDISFEGYIVADSGFTVEQLKKTLNRLINPLHELDITSNGYKITVKPQNSVQYSKKWTENNEVLCNFAIDFIAFYPFFKYKNDEIIKESEAKGTALFPLVIDQVKKKIFGRIPFYGVGNINNDGDAYAGFTLTVLADTDKIQYLKGTNKTTGEAFNIPVGLEVGEQFVISTVTGDKFVKKVDADGVEKDITNMITKDSSFWQLQPGYNELDFESDNNYALKFTIKYSPSFMEVLQ